MKINKHVLNRALRVLGKVVRQTSPEERSLTEKVLRLSKSLAL